MDWPFLFHLFYFSRVNTNPLNSFFLIFVSFHGPHSSLNEDWYSWGSRKEEKKLLWWSSAFKRWMSCTTQYLSSLIQFLWLADPGFLSGVKWKLAGDVAACSSFPASWQTGWPSWILELLRARRLAISIWPSFIRHYAKALRNCILEVVWVFSLIFPACQVCLFLHALEVCVACSIIN